MFNLALPTTPTSAQPYAVPTERLLDIAAANTRSAATMAVTGPGPDVAPPPAPPSYSMTEAVAVFNPTHNYNFGFNWADKALYTPLSPETPTPARFAPSLSTDLTALNRDFARRMSEPQYGYTMASSPLSSPSPVSPLSRHGSWASTRSIAEVEDRYEPIGAPIAPPIALPELPTILPTPPDVSPRRQRASTIRETISPEIDMPPPPKRRKKKISKMHPCSHPDCNKSFPRPSALATHMNVHSGDKRQYLFSRLTSLSLIVFIQHGGARFRHAPSPSPSAPTPGDTCAPTESYKTALTYPSYLRGQATAYGVLRALNSWHLHALTRRLCHE